MRMRQSDLNAALAAYVKDGDEEAWREVIVAIRAGQVVVRPGLGGLTLKAIERPATAYFGARLRELRERSGIGQQELADQLAISLSSVIRQLQGHVLPQWSSVQLLVTSMGGEPAEYRADWEKAKAEHRRKRHDTEVWG